MATNQKFISLVKLTLREPMTLEELHSLMTERWTAQLPGKFQYKKGLFGSYIRFDTYMKIQPRIKVKDGVVQITRVTVESKVNGVDLKAAKQAINAVKGGGGLMDIALGGPEYFINVCDAMRELLQGRLAE